MLGAAGGLGWELRVTGLGSGASAVAKSRCSAAICWLAAHPPIIQESTMPSVSSRTATAATRALIARPMSRACSSPIRPASTSPRRSGLDSKSSTARGRRSTSPSRRCRRRCVADRSQGSGQFMPAWVRPKSRTPSSQRCCCAQKASGERVLGNPPGSSGREGKMTQRCLAESLILLVGRIGFEPMTKGL